MRYIAPIIFGIMLGLMTAAPASAQYSALRPSGAVPLLDGCNAMAGYPDCHPDRVYEGRSVAGPMRPGIRGAARMYPSRTQFYPEYRR
jgi:hypothetical protein